MTRYPGWARKGPPVFQVPVVALLDSIANAEDSMEDLAGLDEVSSREVLAEEETFIIHDTLSDPATLHAVPRVLAEDKGIVRVFRRRERRNMQERGTSTLLCGRTDFPSPHVEGRDKPMPWRRDLVGVVFSDL
ncbi:hypothetical protein C7212DRAFT_366234 [Tuber magnatum]|uniref:Uncharacterized protein n=1 Tax=Tuber magnatum TaxID=42249 RepID=A0A317SHU9_9PEZI|nr:hypothetical protein C7212DRAFT_366234 [Tuber magnatum]